MERIDEPEDKRANTVGGVIADMNELIGIAAIAVSLGTSLLPRGGARPLPMSFPWVHWAPSLVRREAR